LAQFSTGFCEIGWTDFLPGGIKKWRKSKWENLTEVDATRQGVPSLAANDKFSIT
jgi:hypothetical protein